MRSSMNTTKKTISTQTRDVNVMQLTVCVTSKVLSGIGAFVGEVFYALLSFS